MNNNRPALFLSCLTAVLLAASFATNLWDLADGWLLRLGTLAAWTACLAVTLRTQAHRAVAGPLFVLASLSLFFFSLIPALVTAALMGPPMPLPPGADAFFINQLPAREQTLSRLAMGSEAERLVLQFVLAALTVTPLATVSPTATTRRTRPTAIRLILGLAIAVVAATAYHMALVHWPDAGWTTEVRTTAPVMVTVVLAYFALAAEEGDRRSMTAFGLTVAVALALMLPNANKALTFAIVILLIIILMGKAVPARWRTALLALLLIIPLVAQASLAMQRHLATSQRAGTSGPDLAIIWVESKVVFRQTESLYCLIHVAKAADAGSESHTLGELGWFAQSVVPRALWPAKPSLSLGGDYARAYCGWRATDFNPAAPHSASITLLGEPLIHGGKTGLAVAAALLLAVLALLSRLVARGGPAATAVLGIEPWLVDFDQHLGLYLANGVKLAVVAVAVTLLLWAVRPRRPAA